MCHSISAGVRSAAWLQRFFIKECNGLCSFLCSLVSSMLLQCPLCMRSIPRMKSAELSKDVFTVTAGFSLYLPGLSFILYAITFREDPRSICHTMAEDFKRTGTPAAYSLKKKANKPISQQFVDSLRNLTGLNSVVQRQAACCENQPTRENFINA